MRGCLAWGVVAGCGFSAPATGDGRPHDDDRDLSCSTAPDLAWWRFDSPGELDLVGRVPAIPYGTIEAIDDGPCGVALEFGLGASIPYLVIEDRPAWDTLRRLDLWVRTTSSTQAGILSRDSLDSSDGTIGLWETVKTDGVTPMFAVRLQRRIPDTTELLCAPRPPARTWTRVELEFGAEVSLWIDGVRSTDTTSQVDHIPGISSCGTSTIPMGDSPDPWVLGASSATSDVGMVNQLTDGFSGGAVSNLRWFSTPRGGAR